MTEPARATAWASGESWLTRWRTASSSVSGTAASRIARLSARCSARQRSQQLFDMQWHAVGPLEERPHDRLWRGPAGSEDQVGHQPRLLEVQRLEPHFFAESLGQQPRSPFPQQGPGLKRVVAVRRDEQQPVVAGHAGQLGQDLQAQVVGPLEVIKREHRWLGAERSRSGRRRCGRGAVVRALVRRSPPPQRASSSRPSSANSGIRAIERAMSSTDAAGTSWSCGATNPLAVLNPAAFALLLDGIHQARLADAGLARQEQEGALAARPPRQVAIGQLEQRHRARRGPAIPADRTVTWRKSTARSRGTASVE